MLKEKSKTMQARSIITSLRKGKVKKEEEKENEQEKPL